MREPRRSGRRSSRSSSEPARGPDPRDAHGGEHDRGPDDGPPRGDVPPIQPEADADSRGGPDSRDGPDIRSRVVGIVMGSDSDLPVLQKCLDLLEEFDVPYEVSVMSAHRTPERAHEYATTARLRGLKILIAAAGGAAHLAGVMASLTTIPVIGVPMPTPSLGGADSLYSTVQMPAGIPVATVALGEAGAANAALLAVEILALEAEDLHH